MVNRLTAIDSGYGWKQLHINIATASDAEFSVYFYTSFDTSAI